MSNSKGISYFIDGMVGVIVALFALWWTSRAVELGAPGGFVLWGVILIGISIAAAVWFFRKSAKAEEEYESIDNKINYISLNNNEPVKTIDKNNVKKEKSKFCPYCGTPASGYFDTCLNCGKKLQ